MLYKVTDPEADRSYRQAEPGHLQKARSEREFLGYGNVERKDEDQLGSKESE